MKYLLFLLAPALAFASALPPTPFPVFLKAGFSSVLEFEEAPVRAVLGDTQSFQVEKVERSLVVRTLTAYAASNMFVYFRDAEPRLFVLTASEDANPTYYKKFENPAPPKQVVRADGGARANVRAAGGRVIRHQFDARKDYLTVSIELAADSSEPLRPNWSLIRLAFKGSALVPYKLWAERQEVQRDSSIKARMIFAKPNVPRDLAGVTLVVPLQGKASPITLALKGAL